VFGEVEERLEALFRHALIVCGIIQLQRDLRQRFSRFQLAEIVKNCLLDQPVWRAVNLLRRQFNAIAGGFIQLRPHGGGSHDFLVLKV